MYAIRIRILKPKFQTSNFVEHPYAAPSITRAGLVVKGTFEEMGNVCRCCVDYSAVVRDMNLGYESVKHS